jgi:hypothetical protein
MHKFIGIVLSLLLVGCTQFSTVTVPYSQVTHPKDLVEVTGLQSSTVESTEYNVVKTDMNLKYDPYNATSFFYNIVVISQSMREVIVDVDVYADGRLIKQFTTSVDPFKKSYYSAEAKFDRPSQHKFEVKISKISYINP